MSDLIEITEVLDAEYDGPERRATPSGHAPLGDDPVYIPIFKRCDAEAIRIIGLEAKVDGLEKKVDTNNLNTAEILEIVQMAKGFFKVLGHIGGLVKWGFAIGASIAAIVAAWKSGHIVPPPP